MNTKILKALEVLHPGRGQQTKHSEETTMDPTPEQLMKAMMVEMQSMREQISMQQTANDELRAHIAQQRNSPP